MTDIAGISSLSTDFARSTPPQSEAPLQRTEEERRVDERSSINPEDSGFGNGNSQRTEFGQPQSDSSSAGGQDRPSEPDQSAKRTDTVSLSPEARAGSETESTAVRPNTAGEGDETNQLASGRNERTGNTPDTESEASRTLGQVLDVFA